MQYEPIEHISVVKTIWYLPVVSVGTWLCDFLHLSPVLLTLLLVVIIFDFIAAGYKNAVLEIPFSLTKLKTGIYQKIIIFVFLFTIGILIAASKVIVPEIVTVFKMTTYVNGVAFLLITSEVLSVWNNIQKGKKKSDDCEIDYFSLILRFAKNKIEHKLRDKIGDN